MEKQSRTQQVSTRKKIQDSREVQKLDHRSFVCHTENEKIEVSKLPQFYIRNFLTVFVVHSNPAFESRYPANPILVVFGTVSPHLIRMRLTLNLTRLIKWSYYFVLRKAPTRTRTLRHKNESESVCGIYGIHCININRHRNSFLWM